MRIKTMLLLKHYPATFTDHLILQSSQRISLFCHISSPRDVIIYYVLLCAVVTGQLPSNISLRYQLMEDPPLGSVVADLFLDSRLPLNVMFQFNLHARPTGDAYFSVGERTGVITVAMVIDRDVLCANNDVCYLAMDVIARRVIATSSYVTYVIHPLTPRVLETGGNGTATEQMQRHPRREPSMNQSTVSSLFDI